jgi:hypothetical protein
MKHAQPDRNRPMPCDAAVRVTAPFIFAAKSFMTVGAAARVRDETIRNSKEVA